ncbi:MAG: DUF4959 domain-containing protein [Prolixibacteraceae bacterium]|jgi:hypothetical protein|nr:DUF4959 domain-containing protein [Prolixibacteraceae bacterium]NLS99646.1 DUF4959 domain-containing protein [Bacteroidales bacterium]HNZ67709.1 DUF4959 domain-containing protein [Prolixibacteraceae bacterium]HOC85467.1 DUF4959 domain-containing protein [Prolixibacteraceae bacterium]HOG94685.1 DUF4959 domain-containing protein [Prolixibacteraceae bacterium]
MKISRIINALLVLSLLIVFGCEEIEREPITKDSVPPGVITSLVVENIPGGAVITYALPKETDLLYVKAEYELSNGKKVETRSSIYASSVQVEGFGDTREREVKLYAVDRSENISAPVTVKVQPLTPPVHMVKNTMEVIPDFGGAQYTWTNETNAPLAFIIITQDSTGALNPVETVYTSVTDGKYTVRGFDPEEKIFAIVIRDRWDNYSDTVKVTLTPMFEEKLDKSKFDDIVLPGDTDMNGWEGRSYYIFDDDINTFNHSLAGTGWPQYFTIDLGVTARLSRVIVIQRQSFPYSHGNPRLLEVWGIEEAPPADGSWDNWIKLRDCVATKPSAMGGTADEDANHLKKGDEYSFTLEDPPVRYIRFLVNETWGVTGFIHFAEVTFYGQVVGE